jgi:hypothetical protein
MGTYGPYFAGTIANGGGPDNAWNNPSNAGADDNVYADDGLRGMGLSQYLRFTNFGVTGIGSTEIVTGIVISVERKAGGASAVRDSGVFLIVDGVMGGTNHEILAPYSTTNEIVAYGGEPDLWGWTLTPTQVQSSNFGFALRTLRIVEPPTPYTASIDWAKLTVYTAASGEWMSATGCITLFITGYAPIASSIPLFTINIPPLTTSGTQPLYTRGSPIGIDELFNTNELWMGGYSAASGGLNLYINQNPDSASITNLYTYGKAVSNNNLSLFAQNTPQVGGTASVNLFSKGLDPAESIPSSSGNINKYTTLYSYGGAISVGAGATSSSSATYSPLTQLNMFLKGAVSDDHTSNMNMFIGGQWFAKANSTTLFMYNRIEPLNGNTKLYVRGLGSVDSEGYTPGGSYMNLYIARNTAGAANLFMIGPKYNINNTINLYINSNPTSNNNVALSLPYSWSNLNNGVNTYVNGW